MCFFFFLYLNNWKKISDFTRWVGKKKKGYELLNRPPLHSEIWLKPLLVRLDLHTTMKKWHFRGKKKFRRQYKTKWIINAIRYKFKGAKYEKRFGKLNFMTSNKKLTQQVGNNYEKNVKSLLNSVKNNTYSLSEIKFSPNFGEQFEKKMCSSLYSLVIIFNKITVYNHTKVIKFFNKKWCLGSLFFARSTIISK